MAAAPISLNVMGFGEGQKSPCHHNYWSMHEPVMQDIQALIKDMLEHTRSWFK